LRVRQDHELSAWVQSELARRFDFRCCEDMEQFQRSPGLALTRQRHVKYGRQHHEKDDRQSSFSSRNFVLGWDNAERLHELRESLESLRQQESEVLDSIQTLESDSKRVSVQMAAVEAALSVSDFESIDVGRHRHEIEQLEAERKAIEDSNDAVRVLREQLDKTLAAKSAAQGERDSAIALESGLQRENEQANHLLQKYESILQAREAEGSLNAHRVMFEPLELSLAEKLAEVQDFVEFSELQNEATRDLQHKLTKLTRKSEPLQAEIVRAMQRFLSDSPEEKADLRADLLYLDGFLGLLEQLRRDDLPKYEQRFQQRLNEKVIQELGVFHAALQCEKQEIQSKIDTLNSCLQQLEYREGTYMRLEPRKADDREIKDFQTLLRQCLDSGFEADPEVNEARYQQIEKLIHRLREEERWRDKVTDVRRWFDFASRELDVVTGEEHSCYEDSSGQSGGEKAKLAFTILVAAIAYQFDIDPTMDDDDRFHFVVVDEMFSKVDDRFADYALQLFEKFGLQLLIVAPLDAKARVTEPYVGRYLHTVKNERTRTSEVISLTAEDYEQAVGAAGASSSWKGKRRDTEGAAVPSAKPR
ncbi:MAG: hypothetical protein NXI32_04685, partial [bacterium]|nr:hypothetical protein [bacterium]